MRNATLGQMVWRLLSNVDSGFSASGCWACALKLVAPNAPLCNQAASHIQYAWRIPFLLVVARRRPSRRCSFPRASGFVHSKSRSCEKFCTMRFHIICNDPNWRSHPKELAEINSWLYHRSLYHRQRLICSLVWQSTTSLPH